MNVHADALFDRPFFCDPVSVTKPSVGFSWNSAQEFFTEKQLSRKRDFRRTRCEVHTVSHSTSLAQLRSMTNGYRVYLRLTVRNT